jgi:hypothetical protein
MTLSQVDHAVQLPTAQSIEHDRISSVSFVVLLGLSFRRSASVAESMSACLGSRSSIAAAAALQPNHAALQRGCGMRS